MSTAEDLQRVAIQKADGYASQLQRFIDQMFNAVLGGTGYQKPTIVNKLDISEIKSALNGYLAQAQLDPPAIIDPPLVPVIDPLTFTPIYTGGLAVPTFTTIAIPKLLTPDVPNVTSLGSTGSRPALSLLDTPKRPDILLPDTPAFDNLIFPAVSDIVIPILDALPPPDDLITPTNLFSFNEVAYSSALLDASKAKLLHDLSSGGYGIDTNDEHALWARAIDRESRGSAIASADVVRSMAARGFSLPPGAMLAQLAAVQQDMAEKVSSVSRDIALKRADLYVENRRFTITEVRELEQILVGAHMAIMERTLNASKVVIEFSISLFNAKVAKFNTLMEGYKTKVGAYGELVRASLSQVEIQKLKMESVQIQAGVQKTKAEIYNIQLEGQKTIMEVYRTDVTALQGLADVERLKVESFRAEIEAYAERVRAGSLQLQSFEAQIRGNQVQIEMYKTQVDAQLVQAELVKAQASVIESNSRVSVENLRATISNATAIVDIYRAQSSGIASANESQSRAFSARTEAFRSIAAIYDSLGRVQVSDADLTMRAATENLRSDIEQSKEFYNYRLGSGSAAMNTLGEGIRSQLGQVLGIASAVTTSTL